MEKEQAKEEEQGVEENRHHPGTSQKPASPTPVLGTKPSPREPLKNLSDQHVNGMVTHPVPGAILLSHQIKSRRV